MAGFIKDVIPPNLDRGSPQRIKFAKLYARGKKPNIDYGEKTPKTCWHHLYTCMHFSFRRQFLMGTYNLESLQTTEMTRPEK